MKYIKWLSPLFIITLITLVGCSAQDPVEKWYSEGLIPGSSTSNNTIGDNASPFDIGAFKKLYITDNTSLLDFAGNPISFGGGSSDHATLSHLDYASAGHTGFEPAIGYTGNPLQFLDGTGNFAIPAGGASGNVTATANLTDNTIIRGDGGGLGVQASGVTIDDFDNLDTNGGDVTGFDINADNDVNVTNDLEVTDDAFVGGNLELVGTANITGGLSANLDFNQFTAIAMVCDKGDTVPVAPAAGQWFYHTPTGRNILMIYNGTSWSPIISTGSMTVYVDKTDGTDDVNHGTAVDGDAFATVQYAVDTIPGLMGGNVIIYINAESYAETVTIQGKTFTGAYSITLQGTLTVHDNIVSDGNGDKGATTTKPSFYKNGMTANHYQHQLIKFTSGANNGLYRVIDSNSNDAGTRKIVCCGPTLVAQPVANDTATVYDWGTTITNLVISDKQNGVNVYDTYFNSGAATSVSIGNMCSFNAYRIKTGGTGYGISVTFHSNAIFYQSMLANTNTGIGLYKAVGYLLGCKIKGFTTYGIYGENFASVYPRDGTVIDGGTAVAQSGVYLGYSTLGIFWTADVYNFMVNCQYGIRAVADGFGSLTASNSYSGNTSNESADATSYID